MPTIRTEPTGGVQRVEVEVPPGATPRASPAAAQSTHALVDAHSLSAAAGGVPPSGGR